MMMGILRRVPSMGCPPSLEAPQLLLVLLGRRLYCILHLKAGHETSSGSLFMALLFVNLWRLAGRPSRAFPTFAWTQARQSQKTLLENTRLEVLERYLLTLPTSSSSPEQGLPGSSFMPRGTARHPHSVAAHFRRVGRVILRSLKVIGRSDF